MSKEQDSTFSCEYVELKIKVAKPIVEFVEALCGFIGVDVDGFWQQEIREAIQSLMEAPGSYVDAEWLKKRYGLTAFLRGQA